MYVYNRVYCFINIFILIISLSFIISACSYNDYEDNHDGGYSLSLLGGIKRSFEQMPGYFVVVETEDGFGLCSGVHIGLGVVLTAAHCVLQGEGVVEVSPDSIGDDNKPMYRKFHAIRYLYLDQNNNKKTGYLPSALVYDIVYHPQFYLPTQQNQPGRDIAMIFTSPPSFAPFADLVALPGISEKGPAPIPDELVIMGYGVNMALYKLGLDLTRYLTFTIGTVRRFDEYLQGHPSIRDTGYRISRFLGLEPPLEESNWLRFPDAKIFKDMFYFSNSTKPKLSRGDVVGSCYGDSGGPLVKMTPDQQGETIAVLYGLVSLMSSATKIDDLDKSAFYDEKRAKTKLSFIDEFLTDKISRCATNGLAVSIPFHLPWIFRQLKKHQILFSDL